MGVAGTCTGQDRRPGERGRVIAPLFDDPGSLLSYSNCRLRVLQGFLRAAFDENMQKVLIFTKAAPPSCENARSARKSTIYTKAAFVVSKAFLVSGIGVGYSASGCGGVMTSAVLPACYAMHRLSDGSWELLAQDDDPYRPAWRWVVVISAPTPIPRTGKFFRGRFRRRRGADRNATRLRHG